MRRSSKFRRIQCAVQKKAHKHFEGNALQDEISKLVMRLVRHYDQEERETDGAVHWNSIGPKLRKAFQKAGRAHFLGLQYCKNSREVLLYIRAIQGHTGGNMTASELMGQIVHSHKWKEFLFHRGCSYKVTLILKSGLIAGGRESKEGRQTIFFTPLNRFGDNPDEEEPNGDLSTPRKVHYHSKWKPSQDAVYWINLARARQRTTFLAKQIPCRNCFQPCAGRLHLSSDFRKNFIRKTLDASSRTEDSTQECLAITAAATAAAARHIGGSCFGHQETGAKRGTRYSNRQPKTTEHLDTDAKCCVTC